MPATCQAHPEIVLCHLATAALTVLICIIATMLSHILVYAHIPERVGSLLVYNNDSTTLKVLPILL
jgi:hypothetical protein